jgi:hypothetical protein
VRRETVLSLQYFLYRDIAFVAHTAIVPRTFVEVQREIEKTARNLKETKDPEARRALLKEMSLLLKEADRITASLRVAVGGS